MRSAWPIVRAAANELWVAALLGLLGGVGILWWGADSPTLPLLPVALAGMWGGVAAGGGERAKLVHLLSRPIDRTTMLALRTATLAALLLIVSATLYGAGMVFAGDHGDLPGPLVFMLIGVCMLAGVNAGALAEREALAVGGAMLGAALLLAPPAMLTFAFDLTWSRLEHALGSLRWPMAAAVVASAVLPLPIAWHALPCRNLRWLMRTAKLALGVAVLEVVFAWSPVIVIASSPRSGSVIGLYQGPGATRVLATGNHGDSYEDARVDGLLLVDGDEERVLFDSSTLRSLGGGVAGLVEIVAPSPDREWFALALRVGGEERHVVLVRAATGESTTVERGRVSHLVWSRDGTHLLAHMRDGAHVYRVDDVIEPVSSHVTGWLHSRAIVRARDGHQQAADGYHADLGAWAGQVFAGADLPPDLGWTGNVGALFEYTPLDALVLFDGPTQMIRRVPVDLDGENPSQSPAWLDDDHIALLTRTKKGIGARQRLWVIDVNGSVIANAPIDNWLGIERIMGPPAGPWLVATKTGRVEAWAADGEALWQEFVLPFGDSPAQVPFVVDGDHVEAIGRDGRLWSHEVPWKGAGR